MVRLYFLPVITNKTDVVESAESYLIFLPGVELPVLHIWNVWPGVVTFLHHRDGGIIVDEGAETILRVREHKLGHPDVQLLWRGQSIQASVVF